MITKIGTILDNIDPFARGELSVRFDNEETINLVHYTTPYGGNAFAGLIAIPEIGTRVICVKPDNSSEWYFMSCAYDTDNITNTKYTVPSELGVENSPYSHDPYPRRVSLKTPLGSLLEISDAQNTTDMSRFAKLKSALERAFIANDTPTNDSIGLFNEHGDKVKISSEDYTGTSGPRSIDLETLKNIFITSIAGDIEIGVDNGRTISLLNRSQKRGMTSYDGDLTPGEVNVESYHNDINIKVRSTEGRIFIDADGSDGVIQIRSKGSVKVIADGNIDLKSSSDINIKAAGTINLQGSEVQLNPTYDVTLTEEKTNAEEMNQNG